MATIWIGCSGEGRGHATRVRTLVEALRPAHRLRVFAAGAAFDFLTAAYGAAAPDVRVRRIPGLMFRYRGGRVSLPGTLFDSAAYVARLEPRVAALRRLMEADPPDLVVSDFEPTLPRAAVRCGVPVVSLDHQHFMLACDLSELPPPLRLHAWTMRPMMALFCPGRAATVVSSFYFPPLRPGLKNVVQVGTLLRPEVRDAAPCDAGHVVAYLRKFGDPATLDALARCGRRVLVYGLGERPPQGGLRFRAVADGAFVADLAACTAVVCNAGNQLVGESLFLGKPVLAIPEPGQPEQAINAHFLRAGGGGDSIDARAFAPAPLARFLADRDQYIGRVDRARLRGNEPALAVLRRHLPAS